MGSTLWGGSSVCVCSHGAAYMWHGIYSACACAHVFLLSRLCARIRVHVHM